MNYCDNDDLPKLGMFARRPGYFLKSGYEPVAEGLSRRVASSNARRIDSSNAAAAEST